jgi:hypothetical protein
VKVNVEAPKAKRRSSPRKTTQRQPLTGGMTPVSGLIEHHRPLIAPSRHPESATPLMLESDRRNLNLLQSGSIDDIFNARSRGAIANDFSLYDDLNNRNIKTRQASESGRTGTVFDATVDNLDTRSNKSDASMTTAHSLDKLLRTIDEHSNRPSPVRSNHSPLSKDYLKERETNPSTQKRRNSKGQFARP